MDETAKSDGQGRARPALDIAKETVKKFNEGATDRAAAMAYYAIQAVFPALLVIVIVSLLLSSPGAVKDAVNWLAENGLDRKAADSLNETLQRTAERASGGAGFAAVALAVTSVYSASGWLAAAGRAIEPDQAKRRERNFVIAKVRFSLWTLTLLAALVLAIVLLNLGGDVADEAFTWVGWGDGAPRVWPLVQPVLVLLGIVATMLLLFRVAPDRVRPRPWKALLPGAVLSGLGWVVATGAFAFYVRNLATLGATYGAFATPIALLIWLWLSGVVVLLGAALNGVLAERRGDEREPLRLEGADDPAIAGHPAGALPDPAEDDELIHPAKG